MTRARLIAEMVHVLALAVWLGSLVMAGAVAAQVFPLLRQLDPIIPAWTSYTGEHWLIIAGRIGEFTFFTVDLIGLVALAIAIITLIGSIVMLGLPLARISTLLRAVGLGAVVMLASYQLFVLAPTMNKHLHQQWAAAEAGDNDLAEEHRRAFSALHPTATRVLVGSALGVAMAIAAAVWSIGVRDDRDASPYPEPALGAGEL